MLVHNSKISTVAINRTTTEAQRARFKRSKIKVKKRKKKICNFLDCFPSVNINYTETIISNKR